jgi:hypothetical protein
MSGAMSASILARPLVALFLSIGVAACGGSSSGSPATAEPEATPAFVGDPSCPVEVPGTSVSVEDAGGGVALVFVTTGDVADVRRRAGEMARMHNDHHSKMGPLPAGAEVAGADGHDHGAMAAGGAHDHHASGPAEKAGSHAGHAAGASADGEGHAGHDKAGPGAGHSGHEGHAGGMIGVHARATVEEAPDGARVVFLAAPADVAKLREELAMHARHLASGTCSMSAGR